MLLEKQEQLIADVRLLKEELSLQIFHYRAVNQVFSGGTRSANLRDARSQISAIEKVEKDFTYLRKPA